MRMDYKNCIICYISQDKLDEYLKFWARYHVSVQIRSPLEGYNSEEIFAVLSDIYDKHQPLAVMTEYADITDTTLTNHAWWVSRYGNNEMRSKDIPIRWDTSRPKLGLGWDNHVILPNGLSCFDMWKRDNKNIGRQEIFSAIATQLCHDTYKKWNFIPADLKESVIHDNITSSLIENNIYLNTPEMHTHWLMPLFHRALQRAEIVRTGNTRPLRNYWLPGLNAGLPSVPKKDYFHETTFLVHDLCHFIFPDVIYNGDRQTLKHYHIARMASEAITMTFADMWFVDVIAHNHVYDYSKRCIYPLFLAIKNNHPDITPYDLAWANTQYAVLGDTSEYERYISLTSEEWKNFEGKFSRFFIEDHHWTYHNTQRMLQNSDHHQKFVEANSRHIERLGLTLSNTMTDVKIIFDDMWNRYIMSNSTLFKRTKKDHYWLGQSFIFYNYPSHSYKTHFLNAWEEGNETAMKEIYGKFLDYLLQQLYINQDEYYHFQHMYPFFQAHYVFYERNSSDKLSEVAKQYVLS